jgi:hypothetical protein
VTRVRVAPSWLALREQADHVARSSALAEDVRRGLLSDRPLVIHDLASGTGAMLRWLAPRLPGPQHWIAHDVDTDLLAVIEQAPHPLAADRAPVTIEVRPQDVTRLGSGALAEADVITSSALLDLLTADELERFVTTCAAPGCAVLITMSVTGAVRLRPRHRLDAAITRAFNAHQRRTTGGRTLLGPDAADAAVRMFAGLGREVVTRPSPWRLGADTSALSRAWLAGRVDAVREQEPGWSAALDDYAAQREADLASGRLRVVVGHCDLLVRPAEMR